MPSYHLTQEEQERNNTLYKEFRENYGHTAEGLGWNSLYDQEKRFEILLDIIKFTGTGLHNASILDVGCGFGDLYAYIAKNVSSLNYTGIDINEQHLATAKKRHPKAAFIKGDILKEKLPRFDVVFSSGLFATKVKDNEKFIKAMIARMVELSKKGVAFNFLQKTFLVCNLAEYEKKEIYTFCKKQFKNVKMLDNYLPDDVTILIKK